MKNFIHLANRPELSFGMRTENINGKEIMLLHPVNYIHQSQQYLVSSPKLQYRLGENALEKPKPIKSPVKLLAEEQAYILSVNPISKTKRNSLMEKRPTLLNYSKRLNRSLKESITFTELN